VLNKVLKKTIPLLKKILSHEYKKEAQTANINIKVAQSKMIPTPGVEPGPAG
jgi:hypothetical protein